MVEFSQFFTFYYLAEYSAGWPKISAEYSVSVVHYFEVNIFQIVDNKVMEVPYGRLGSIKNTIP